MRAAAKAEHCQQQFALRVAGIPKRTEQALRPIAVESAALRAFNRALLLQFPPLPPGQYCGVKGETAASATVAWLRTDAVKGAELDLRRAFDTVHHAVARAGALAAGVPAPIVEFLAHFVWPAPRYCVVHGAAPSRPVHACTGLPAGDPCSPSLLAYVLAPWRLIVESCPEIRAFLFMDDRSIVDLGGRPDSEDALGAALELSQWVDATLGLQEHRGKRQLWDRRVNPDASVEHLGITTAPNSRVFPELHVSEPQVCSLAAAITCLPGGMAVCERLLQGLVLPKLLWSAPLTPKLSPAVTEAFYRAIRGPCTWWCKGRVWADRVSLHPEFAAAICCLAATQKHPVAGNVVLQSVVCHHAERLQLQVTQDSPQGVLLQPLPGAPAQVVRAVRTVARAQQRPNACFAAAGGAGHGLRVVARALALTLVRRTRADAEGCHDIDLEAQSHPRWKLWRSKLSAAARTNLDIFRGGAVKTKSRRYWNYGRAFCRCPCGHAVASSRHLFQECPRLDADRRRLQQTYGLAPAFWTHVPRCTSKSGWITMSASPCADTRVRMQIAACSLGLVIVPLAEEVSFPA